MKLLNKTKSPKEAAIAASLADRIKQIQAEAEAYIQSHVDKLKADPDARLLPRPWLELDTRLKFGRDPCTCALAIIELEEKK